MCLRSLAGHENLYADDLRQPSKRHIAVNVLVEVPEPVGVFLLDACVSPILNLKGVEVSFASSNTGLKNEQLLPAYRETVRSLVIGGHSR